MKKLALLFLFTTQLCIAASCPEPSAFHYNNGLLEAQGGWVMPARPNSKAHKFISVTTLPGGDIAYCHYQLTLDGQSMQVSAITTDALYHADGYNAAVWHRTSYGKICYGPDPSLCTFHRVY